jgi:hypothetical protein
LGPYLLGRPAEFLTQPKECQVRVLTIATDSIN